MNNFRESLGSEPVKPRGGLPPRVQVTHVSYSLLRGGAARSACNLHAALLDAGANSKVLSIEDESPVKLNSYNLGACQILKQKFRKNLEIHIPKLRYPATSDLFSPSWFGENLHCAFECTKNAVLHLHWVNWGLVRIEDLGRCQRPIVWTLHDMWPMTGGCHFSGDCNRYQDSCGRCPVLRSTRQSDLSFSVLERKKRSWRNLPLHLVAPSEWIASCARKSAIFRGTPVSIIPYGVETDNFRPFVRGESCEALGIPPNPRYILTAAFNVHSDRRKGFRELITALSHFKETHSASGEVQLLVAGMDSNDLPPNLPLPAIALGHIREKSSMAQAYAVADLFVAPSLEDNLPNTVLESLACGTPVAAFRIGGMPDMIEDFSNGRLASPTDSKALAECIAWILEDQERLKELGRRARETALTRFTLTRQADAYLSLYREILAHQKPQ